MNSVKKRLPFLVRGAGIFFVILGLLLAFGGGYLIILGGVWFYLIAGISIIGIGIGLCIGRSWAFWWALLLLVGSAIWAYNEVGIDFWQLVPRSIVFIVIAMVTTLCAPYLTRKTANPDSLYEPALGAKKALILAFLLAVALISIFAGMFYPHPTVVSDDTLLPPITESNAGDNNGKDWPAWGRDTEGNRFVQFEQINKSNVKDLKVAWTYRTGDLAVDGAEYQVTPIKIDNTVYLCTPLNKIIALDAVSGKEKWRFDPKPEITESTQNWKRCRGVGYADLDNLNATKQVEENNSQESNQSLAINKNASCRKRIIETTIDARLLAVDAETGKLCEDFGDNGYVNLHEGVAPAPKTGEKGTYNITSAPLVVDGIIMVGGRLNDNLSINEPGGVVRGYDVETGKLLWAWDAKQRYLADNPLPKDEKYPLETPNFWGAAAYDPKLGLAYFPTGNQTPDFWTGNRHPYSNEYTDSIVAIELKTGKERWHFRTANIDQYDYDVSSQPILYDLPRKDGSIVPIVIQLTKRGQIFILDRRDGKPVYPVEYRKVSTDAMPGMQVSDIQPYSSISIGTTPFKESDMWGASIFDQLYCRIQFKKMRWEGEWTPLSNKQRTLIYPGYYGGMNWGGGALDTSRGLLMVNDIRMAQWGIFIKQEEAVRRNLKPSTEGEYSTQTGTPWGVERSMFVSPLGIPCFKPPFGTMTSIDLSTGKTRWQVPLGTIKDAPVHGFVSGLPIPIGMPTMGGPLVTKSGLIFYHGTLDYYVRALDSATGEELWKGRLPVGGQGAPMSYIGEDGKQYIVVVAGGATRTGTNKNRGDYVIAYSLP